MKQQSNSSWRDRNRDGSLLMCTLVCLLVSTSLVGILIHSTIRSRRHSRNIRQLRQTELLLDAGVLRAATRLQADSEYQGEVWEPSIAIDAFSKPKVQIKVTDGEPPAERTVVVTASLGDASVDTQTFACIETRRSHTFFYQIPSSPNPESSNAE